MPTIPNSCLCWEQHVKRQGQTAGTTSPYFRSQTCGQARSDRVDGVGYKARHFAVVISEPTRPSSGIGAFAPAHYENERALKHSQIRSHRNLRYFATPDACGE